MVELFLQLGGLLLVASSFGTVDGLLEALPLDAAVLGAEGVLAAELLGQL